MAKVIGKSVAAGAGSEAAAEAGDRELEQIRSLANLPSENPNPIVRVAGDNGTVLYANEAARELPGLIEGADALTAALAKAVAAAFKAAEAREAEFASRDRIFVFGLTPVAGESYVNLYGRDVTEERGANAAAQSLAKFPSENPNPILRVMGDDGAVLYANEAARDLAGLLGDDDALTEALVEAVSEAHRAGEVRTAEFPSGDRVQVFALTPVAGESYVNLYGRDVTDERRADAAAQSLAKFPSENPNPILRVMGDDGVVLYANEAARDLAGLLGDAGDLTETLVTAVAAAFEADKVRSAEFPSDDRMFVFALTPVVGEPYVNLYGRDVTEERLANQKVIEVRNFNENILKNLSNGVIALDLSQRITKTNPAARRILRLAEDDLIDRAASEVFTGRNDWVTESIAKTIAGSDPGVWLDRAIHLGGDEWASVNVTMVPLTDPDQATIGYMLILEDITREKRIKGTMVRFMSDKVVDRLLEVDETLLGGTSQEVTILFSDIREFTNLSEKLGAREMVGVLNDYFAGMVDVIFDHGGTLDKFIGDAIMAVFGAPFVSADDTDNAVAAAVEMLVQLRRFNRARAVDAKPPLDIGIGIDTGQVVAGTIGSPKRMDYTVIGDHVNVAARIESANKYYGTKILISENTLGRLKNRNRLREIDRAFVHGRDKPVTLFEVLDHHVEGSFPNMDAVLAAFEKGLRQYRRREWAKGAEHFAEALRGNPHDRPTQIFLDRCWTYLARPPGDSWTGATAITALSK